MDNIGESHLLEQRGELSAIQATAREDLNGVFLGFIIYGFAYFQARYYELTGNMETPLLGVQIILTRRK